MSNNYQGIEYTIKRVNDQLWGKGWDFSAPELHLEIRFLDSKRVADERFKWWIDDKLFGLDVANKNSQARSDAEWAVTMADFLKNNPQKAA